MVSTCTRCQWPLEPPACIPLGTACYGREAVCLHINYTKLTTKSRHDMLLCHVTLPCYLDMLLEHAAWACGFGHASLSETQNSQTCLLPLANNTLMHGITLPCFCCLYLLLLMLLLLLQLVLAKPRHELHENPKTCLCSIGANVGACLPLWFIWPLG